MKRKNFIASILPATLSFNVIAREITEPVQEFTIPPYLVSGDAIGITSPAGFITPEELRPAIKKIEEWGFQVKTGGTIGKRDFTFGGTDEERTTDLQNMLNDESIKAIMCARGGYGLVRIIDKLDFSRFIKFPKWIIGFSDITVLHSHINSNYNIASLHSKMCNSFPDDWNAAEVEQKETIQRINDCLRGVPQSYHADVNPADRIGTGTGILVGGNLKTLETLSGSGSNLITKNKILFVEDTGEYLYSIDRMFWNLKRSGKLAQLKGLIIGGFKIKKDDEGDEFGKTLQEIVLEKTTEYKYPICFDFPVGHQKNNYALKCGVNHTLTVSADRALLKEN